MLQISLSFCAKIGVALQQPRSFFQSQIDGIWRNLGARRAIFSTPHLYYIHEISARKHLILNYKYKAGLNNYKPIEIKNLVEDLNKPEFDALNFDLYENAVTVLTNKDKIVPIKKIEKEKIAYVSIGNDYSDTFINSLNKYTKVTVIKSDDLDETLTILEDYTKVIIGYHKADGAWKNHDLSFKDLLWIDRIAKQNKTIVTFFTKILGDFFGDFYDRRKLN